MAKPQNGKELVFTGKYPLNTLVGEEKKHVIVKPGEVLTADQIAAFSDEEVSDYEKSGKMKWREKAKAEAKPAAKAD